MMILEEKALKARPIKARSAAHGLDHKSCFRVLADMISIEEIGVRQNREGMIFFTAKRAGVAQKDTKKIFSPDRKHSNTEFHSS